MKKYLSALLTGLYFVTMVSSTSFKAEASQMVDTIEIETQQDEAPVDILANVCERAYVEEPVDILANTCTPEYDIGLSDYEIDLIATIVMAEAEGEPEYGQRLVIDTVLNRVDSPYFPDTVEEVIFQKHQFSPTENGRWERCYPKEELRQLVIEELHNRTDNNVIFFRTGRYSDYGAPMFKVCCHYFSSYE